MEDKLKKTVKEDRDLIQDISDQENPKRKILLNRAKTGLKTFEISMKHLLRHY